MRTLCTFLFLMLLFLILAPLSLQAELYKCNGTWTNQPCEDGAEPVKDLRPVSRSGAAGVPNVPERRRTSRGAQTNSVVGGEQLTRLRVVGSPQGEWERNNRRVTLRAAKVSVKNAGRVAAEEVIVYIVLSDGARVQLTGPATLDPNQSATYSSSVRRSASINDKLSAEVSCANCR